MSKKVTPEQLVEITKKALIQVEAAYGYSKHHNTPPHIFLSEDKADGRKGEYCFVINEISLYYNNISSLEELVRTLIHEYQHYLQSPSWFKRYYNMGYDYNNHPYEVQAYKEEENWKTIWKQAS